MSKADIFTDIATKVGRIFYIQGLVEDELNEVDELAKTLLNMNLLKEISGDEVFASEVGGIAGPYNIGLGEAECIAIAKKNGYSFATDDGKARRAASAELGATRVIGSLGLLTEAVKRKVFTPVDAADAYRQMRVRGAFLPVLDPNYFKKIQIDL